jgi:hypothetical protein
MFNSSDAVFNSSDAFFNSSLLVKLVKSPFLVINNKLDNSDKLHMVLLSG